MCRDLEMKEPMLHLRHRTLCSGWRMGCKGECREWRECTELSANGRVRAECQAYCEVLGCCREPGRHSTKLRERTVRLRSSEVRREGQALWKFYLGDISLAERSGKASLRRWPYAGG